MTKEGWPTRKRGDTYQVFVKGQWLSRQRAAQIRRELASEKARKRRVRNGTISARQ